MFLIMSITVKMINAPIMIAANFQKSRVLEVLYELFHDDSVFRFKKLPKKRL